MSETKNEKVLWASVHNITDEQKKSLEEMGFEVLYLKELNQGLWNRLSNMQLDTNRKQLAKELADYATQVLETPVGLYPKIIQPAGDPAFQFIAGREKLYTAIFAFSQRVSNDVIQEDGTVKKITLFKHEGWV